MTGSSPQAMRIDTVGVELELGSRSSFSSGSAEVTSSVYDQGRNRITIRTSSPSVRPNLFSTLITGMVPQTLLNDKNLLGEFVETFAHPGFGDDIVIAKDRRRLL